MRLTSRQRWFWDAGLWVPKVPAIIRPRERNLLPGFCIPMAVGVATTPNPNAFGTLLFVGGVSSSSISDPFTISTFVDAAEASERVYVGDLVCAALAQASNLTVTAVTDNLGNTYTASNAGTDAGAVTGRMFYSRITVEGIITAINFDTTAGAFHVAGVMGAWAGPFAEASLVDANPANSTGDVSSPHSCPATGTLAQASELVVSWGGATDGGSGSIMLDGMGTGTLARSNHSSSTAGAIGYTVKTNTTTITHTFTSTDEPGSIVLGTTSFRAA